MSTYEQAVKAAGPEQMFAAFPDLESLDSRPNSSESASSKDSSAEGDVFAGHNQEQIRLMNEACIAVDYDDVPYAAGSKKTLHLMTSINQGLLHRAFSVFLFNKDGKLLLQQRASEKITFPDLWTNTCCSHPLAITSELAPSVNSPSKVASQANLDAFVRGAKNAAVRKLDHELGIVASDVPVDKFHFITRIHYMSPSSDVWGEHEIDYILFCQTDLKKLEPSPNEVRNTRWVSADELKEMFTDPKYQFTPWFKLICDHYLFNWWGKTVPSDDKIRRML